MANSSRSEALQSRREAYYAERDRKRRQEYAARERSYRMRRGYKMVSRAGGSVLNTIVTSYDRVLCLVVAFVLMWGINGAPLLKTLGVTPVSIATAAGNQASYAEPIYQEESGEYFTIGSITNAEGEVDGRYVDLESVVSTLTAVKVTGENFVEMGLGFMKDLVVGEFGRFLQASIPDPELTLNPFGQLFDMVKSWLPDWLGGEG